MKGLYRLIHYEFQSLFKMSLLICLSALIIPYFLIQSKIKDYYDYSVHERFEDIYASAGNSYIFIILFTVLCLWFLKSFYANYWGSKSIYTVVTLPVKRGALYFGKLIAFIISLLMLLISQLASILWSYSLVASKLESFNEAQYVMNNGLFLAFIRSDFLRLLFPLTMEGMFANISILTIITTGLYYGVLCERSKRYWGYVMIVAACIMTFRLIKLRTSPPLNGFFETIPNLYLHSAWLLAGSIFFIWHSIKLLKKGAIT